MDQKEPGTDTPKVGTESEAKRPYTPPNAEFVPLKVEERLLACTKAPSGGCTSGNKNS